MKQRGFSMIEIAITLVIFSLLMATAMPNLSSWLRNAKLRSQSEVIQSGIQRARDEAVRRNRPMTFWLINQPGAAFNSSCSVSTTGSAWVVSANTPNGKCNTITATPTDTASAPGQLGVTTSGTAISVTGYSSSGLSTQASSVTFDGFGRVITSGTPTSNLRRIVINYATAATGDRPQRIDVNTNGLVRTCDISVTSSSDPRYCPTGDY